MRWYLRYLSGWGNLLHCFVALCGGEVSEGGQCCCLISGGSPGIHLASSHFTHFPYATGTLLAAALVMIPRVGGFMYVLGPCRPFKQTLLRKWQLLLLPQPTLVFTARSCEALSSWCCKPGAFFMVSMSFLMLLKILIIITLNSVYDKLLASISFSSSGKFS